MQLENLAYILQKLNCLEQYSKSIIMKTTLVLILFTGLMCTNVFAQLADQQPKLHNKQRYNLRLNPNEHLGKTIRDYRTNSKIGDSNIPINTPDGQNPNERKIEITKAFAEDFLVNDRSVAGTKQLNPSISVDGLGNFAIVWGDNRMIIGIFIISYTTQVALL
ncbi:MAG: hypothetical protein MZV64_41565 [Ignavibacteriales bacterium]|nr:hypothetical protein [Ignavibacteriales bacterium]